MESDNESGSIGEIGASKHNKSVFAAKLTDESEFDSRLVESSFSLGTVIHLILHIIRVHSTRPN